MFKVATPLQDLGANSKRENFSHSARMADAEEHRILDIYGERRLETGGRAMKKRQQKQVGKKIGVQKKKIVRRQRSRKSCESCRSVHHRCDRANDDPDQPCKRCVKLFAGNAGKHCVRFVAPVSETPKRRRRTSSKKAKSASSLKKTKSRSENTGILPPGCDSTSTSPVEFRKTLSDEVPGLHSPSPAIVPPLISEDVLLSTVVPPLYNPSDIDQLPSAAVNQDMFIGNFDLPLIPNVAHVTRALHNIDEEIMIPTEIVSHAINGETIEYEVFCLSLNGEQSETRCKISDRKWIECFTRVWSQHQNNLPSDYSAQTLYNVLWIPLRNEYLSQIADESVRVAMSKEADVFSSYVWRVDNARYRLAWNQTFQMLDRCVRASELRDARVDKIVERLERANLEQRLEESAHVNREQRHIMRKCDTKNRWAARAMQEEVLFTMNGNPLECEDGDDSASEYEQEEEEYSLSSSHGKTPRCHGAGKSISTLKAKLLNDHSHSISADAVPTRRPQYGGKSPKPEFLTLSSSHGK